GSSLSVAVCTSDTLSGAALASPVCTTIAPGPCPADAAASCATLGATSRYIQYQATLSSSDNRITPELSDVLVGPPPATSTGTGQNLIARDDAYSINQGAGAALQVLAPGLLANDLGVKSFTQASFVTAPAHGTLTAGADRGSFTYTPAPGFGGFDTFTYQ